MKVKASWTMATRVDRNGDLHGTLVPKAKQCQGEDEKSRFHENIAGDTSLSFQNAPYQLPLPGNVRKADPCLGVDLESSSEKIRNS